MTPKKIYKIRDLRTNKYISLGYKNRSTWSIFPSAVIESSNYKLGDGKNFVVDIFETKLAETVTLKREKI